MRRKGDVRGTVDMSSVASWVSSTVERRREGGRMPERDDWMC